MVAKKNQSPIEKVYDTDYASSSKIKPNRLPIKSPSKSKILRKTNGNINRDCFYKELNRRRINSSTSTVELSDGKIIRKSDIAIPISNSNKIRPFKGNISLPYFLIPNVEVGQKQEGSRRRSKTKKPMPRTRKQVELVPSHNLTRTRVSGSSYKPTRRQTRRSKKLSTPPGYLASDESMLTPSDISDTSEWEWIAGGFPCRDVARERFISDSHTTHFSNGINPNSGVTNNQIKCGVLEDDTDLNREQFEDQTRECPISIFSANRTSSALEQETTTQGEEESTIKSRNLQDEHNPTDLGSITDFPVYEIIDSADDCSPPLNSTNIPGKILLTIRRSSRNCSPPKFYDQRYFIDAVDKSQEASGSAADPIVIEIDDTTTHETDNNTDPAELILLDSDSLSSDQISTPSTNESLRMEVENFGDHSELDSELFNVELENFSNEYRKCNQ